MNKLLELDSSGALVILYDEVLEIFQQNTIDSLMLHNFKNPILMAKVWDALMLEPGISELPQGKLYRYLTQIGYNNKPNGFIPHEVQKFWNLPNIIDGRLIDLICPEVTNLLKRKSKDKSVCIRVGELLLPFKDSNIVKKYLDIYSEELEKIFKKESKDKKDKEYQNLVDQHKISFENTPQGTIINSLLVLNGYHGSIFNGSKLELLIWLATGLRLVDIIQEVTKYIKIRDEVVCTLKFEYQSSVNVEYDYERFGLINSKIYSHYLSECTRIGDSQGRVPKMYPGYSLNTLKSTIRTPVSTPKKSSVSEYEVLKFINDNLNSEFEWVDIKDYLNSFDRLGFKPQLKDSGEGYLGFTLDSELVSEVNKRLTKYDITEFSDIRKLLVGIVDDQVEVTKLSLEELKSFDNDLACQMIEKLLEWDEVTYSQLMGDMKWLRIVGHIGISLRKVSKSSYKVQFNTVSFVHVIELIYKSDSGYSVAKKVLERLGQTKPFYRDVLKDFNPAIWNLHKCQMQLRYE